MKKLFLMLLLAIMGTKVSMAQTDLVATLSHSSSISTYYGANALSEAYTAAVDGDVITLSSGTFNAVVIEKAITLRGAGIFNDDTGESATLILGGLTVNIPNVTISPSIEGIRFSQDLAISSTTPSATITILKSYINGTIWMTGKCSPKFIHCIIAGAVCESNYQGDSSLNVHALFQNCVVGSHTRWSAAFTNWNYVMENCIVEYTAQYCTYRNCIIANEYMAQNTNATNCIGWYNGNDVFANVNGGNNISLNSGDNIFESYKGNNVTWNERYKLTETAAATYLGDDGKQVGIYGGTNPFDPTPTNPQIKKFTVDNSVNNGKLSVKINVE